MQTDKQIIKGIVEDMLRQRVHGLTKKKALEEEAIFLLGASAALQAVFAIDEKELTDYIPPMWIIGPMSGRSVLTHTFREPLWPAKEG